LFFEQKVVGGSIITSEGIMVSVETTAILLKDLQWWWWWWWWWK